MHQGLLMMGFARTGGTRGSQWVTSITRLTYGAAQQTWGL